MKYYIALFVFLCLHVYKNINSPICYMFLLGVLQKEYDHLIYIGDIESFVLNPDIISIILKRTRCLEESLRSKLRDFYNQHVYFLLY